eukprot:scaffold19934_cov50-Attheya_sp.AAC.1
MVLEQFPDGFEFEWVMGVTAACVGLTHNHRSLGDPTCLRGLHPTPVSANIINNAHNIFEFRLFDYHIDSISCQSDFFSQYRIIMSANQGEKKNPSDWDTHRQRNENARENSCHRRRLAYPTIT